MEGSTLPETLPTHGKILINTQHNVVFHGECPLSARFSTQKVIRVAFECPGEDLQNKDGDSQEVRPPTLKQIDIGAARNAKMCQGGEFLVRVL